MNLPVHSLLKNNISIILFLILLGSSSALYAQITFEEGYYITNTGEKVDCYIKNVDWYYNPEAIDIQLTQGGESQRVDIKDMKAFQLVNGDAFIRATVDIDQSSENVTFMRSNREPEFKRQTVMLRQLLEGKATLLSYRESNIRRFFIRMDQGDPVPLVYKKYRVKDYTKTNNQYQQQLFNMLKCEAITLRHIERTDYTEAALEDLFTLYNQCVDPNYEVVEVKEKRDAFHLTLKVGIRSTSLDMTINSPVRDDIEFETKSSVQFGLEAEYILPFNKNKWSLFVEPTYQSYSSEVSTDDDDFVRLSYSSIEIPMGMRHSFFLNATNKIFLEGAIVLDFSSSDPIEFSNHGNLDIETEPSVAFGLGYKYNDKFMIQGRIITGRNLVSKYHNFSTNFQGISLIAGYSFL